MRTVIAGGSGFLGRALSGALTAEGHEVIVLSRHPSQARGRAGGGRAAPRVVQWTPDGTVGAWATALDGADVVVNLAGESIGAGRWTRARKAAILESRLLATRSVVAAIQAAGRPPRLLVSASGQNYYGERGQDEVTESAPRGEDFLSDVCGRWEAEARKAEASSRVVVLRTGLVLSATEGALPRMLLPFKLFAGGRLGNGRQYMAWIHWRDWVDLVRWSIRVDGVAGPLNLSAPAPVPNAQFAAALGRATHRPGWAPAPAFALRAALGEMADSLLLVSIRMVPARALEQGYRFQFEDLDGALSDLLP